ncbi:M20/M25/M40 family metallo-hydrolase [Patescibacteria group bacterium]|jgi:succinyl-diaminopimelate desuccinylase|nr:M20/M25/M40 family metallo-hydrolase [Patescibacteria group bacterium]
MPLQSTLSQLISFRTVTGQHEAAREAFSWIKDQLSPAPLYVREHEFEGFPALVATTKDTKSPKVWLNAHFDVVDGSDHLFVPEVVDDPQHGRVLRGRGAFDMKWATACYIELLRDLGSEAAELDIGLMLTSDEEIGGFNGAKQLLEQEGYRGELAFVPDGGWEEPWAIEQDAKGMCLGRAFAEGRSTHSSRLWNGSNAVVALAGFAEELDRRMRERYPHTGDDHWHPTLNIGAFNGGYAPNQVPDHAELTFDVRYTTPKEQEDIATLIEEVAGRHPGVTWTFEAIEPSCHLDPGNGYAVRWRELATELHGIETGGTRSHGSSDARHFARHDIPTLVVTPRGGGAHGEHEWISLPDLDRYYTVLAAWVRDCATA